MKKNIEKSLKGNVTPSVARANLRNTLENLTAKFSDGESFIREFNSVKAEKRIIRGKKEGIVHEFRRLLPAKNVPQRVLRVMNVSLSSKMCFKVISEEKFGLSYNSKVVKDHLYVKDILDDDFYLDVGKLFVLCKNSEFKGTTNIGKTQVDKTNPLASVNFMLTLSSSPPVFVFPLTWKNFLSAGYFEFKNCINGKTKIQKMKKMKETRLVCNHPTGFSPQPLFQRYDSHVFELNFQEFLDSLDVFHSPLVYPSLDDGDSYEQNSQEEVMQQVNERKRNVDDGDENMGTCFSWKSDVSEPAKKRRKVSEKDPLNNYVLY